MIKVRIQVSGRTGTFAVVACAESLRRAAQSVKEHYPGSSVGIAFPIEPERFFAGRGERDEYVALEAEEPGQLGEVIPTMGKLPGTGVRDLAL